jgi:hypothetical protein
MVDAYWKVKSAGLKKIRLGNLGVFIRNAADRDYLTTNVETNAV